ncbi:MAG: aminoacetone oxidase family FAD-binding enzyme [Bacteroidales bacterium]
MIDTNILVIGGGAAGLLAASRAADRGFSVVLIERFEKCGRKLKITGKGKCNLTNYKPWKDFSNHIYPDKNFFKTAFYHFSNKDMMDYIEGLGVPLKVERGDRVFPKSENSQDIIDVLVNECNIKGVKIFYDFQCINIDRLENARYSSYGIIDKFNSLALKNYSNSKIANFESFKNESSILSKSIEGIFNIHSDKVIIATGGLSYFPIDDNITGYALAKNLGHRIVPTLPALTALIPYKYDLRLNDLLLKNVNLSLVVGNDVVQTEFGEMKFTNDGLEGALGFKLSKKAVRALEKGQKVYVDIDFKPALTKEKLVNKLSIILKDYKNSKLSLKDKCKVLNIFLPNQLVRPIIDSFSVFDITKLPEILKKWRIPITSYVGYRRSVITVGGVSLKDLSRKTMESKITSGVFFVGEVVDLDADTGGYNLQIAFSTAVLAADSAVAQLKEQYHSDLRLNKVIIDKNE